MNKLEKNVFRKEKLIINILLLMLQIRFFCAYPTFKNFRIGKKINVAIRFFRFLENPSKPIKLVRISYKSQKVGPDLKTS